MKKILILSMAALLSVSALAQESKPQFKCYGFIRNYFAYDSRECVAGTMDFFSYLPKDEKIVDGNDLNQVNSFKFAALTSRLGLDVNGYEIQGWKVGAKIETDFYSGVSGMTGTATLRLRQAYVSLGKNDISFKIGQAWHPMATDMPDIISLNTGAPFGPFSRTPQVTADYHVSDALSLTGSAIWQMQYCSNGPAGTSANYIKYGCTPELYFGLSYQDKNLLARVGVDMLSIKPRILNTAGTKKVNDRITTVSPFVFVQYTDGMFKAKAKSVFAQAGEHLNLNGGYGVSAVNSDGSWEYSPTRNSSSWLSLSYGKQVQGVLFAGYVKNFGTKDDVDPTALYFSKNSFSNLNQMWRLTPTVIYNLGKLAFALEYEVTSAQYGTWTIGDTKGLATGDLRWVTNNRLQAMVKFTF